MNILIGFRKTCIRGGLVNLQRVLVGIMFQKKILKLDFRWGLFYVIFMFSLRPPEAASQ